MNNDELLAEAKRRYPIGTVFHSAMSGVDNIKVTKINHAFGKSTTKSIFIDNGHYCVYYQEFDLWAKIISSPISAHESVEIY